MKKAALHLNSSGVESFTLTSTVLREQKKYGGI
jgi:hypothetical protein